MTNNQSNSQENIPKPVRNFFTIKSCSFTNQYQVFTNQQKSAKSPLKSKKSQIQKICQLNRPNKRNPNSILKILQWNCRSFSKYKLEDLLSSFESFDYDAVCLQETWGTEKKPLPQFKGYKLYQQNRQNSKRGGGVATYISRKLLSSVTSRPLLHIKDDTVDCLETEILLKNKKVFILNIYKSPTTSLNTNKMNLKLLPICRNTIICADLNAHHLSWDAHSKEDNLGENIKEWMDDHSLTTLNTYEPTRWGTSKQKESSPDVTIAHVSWSCRSEWKPLTCGNSDHKPISITLYLNDRPKEKSRNNVRACINKTNIPLFNETLAKYLNIQNMKLNPKETARTMHKAFKSASKKAIPLYSEKGLHLIHDKEIKLIVKKRNNLKKYNTSQQQSTHKYDSFQTESGTY